MVTKTDRSRALGVELEVDLTTNPGEINIDGVVDGRLGLGAAGAVSQLGGGERNTITVLWRPFEGDLEANRQIRSTVDDVTGEVRDVLPSTPPGFPTRPSEILPDQLSSVTSVAEAQLWAGLFGNRIVGETPIEFSRDIQFPTVKVPVMNEGDIVNNVPDLPVVIEARPTEAIQNFFSGVLNDVPRVEFDVPIETFIEEVPLSDFNCCELHPDMANLIGQSRSQIVPAVTTGRRRLNRVVEVANQIISNAGVSVNLLSVGVEKSGIEDVKFCGEGPEGGQEAGGTTGLGGGGGLMFTDGGQNQIQTIQPEDISGLSQSRLQDLLSLVRDTDPNIFPAGSSTPARTLIDQARSDLDSIQIDRCKNFFSSSIDQLENGLNEAVMLQDRLEEIRGSLLDLLVQASGISIPCESEFPDISERIEVVMERSNNPTESLESVFSSISELEAEVQQRVDDQGCVDQFLSQLDRAAANTSEVICADEIEGDLISRVSSFSDNARRFSNASPSFRTAKRLNSLISEGESLLSEISQTDMPEPCRRELSSRVRGSLASVRQTGVAELTEEQCRDRFSRVDRQVSSYERTIRQTVSPSNSQIRNLIEQGQDIIDSIENNVDNQDCAEAFIDRVKTQFENLRQRNVQVRISTVGAREAQEQRQEEIQRLQTQLNDLLQRFAEQQLPELPEQQQ